MFIMFTVTMLCAAVLITLLLRVACRYRADLWFTSDNIILCFVAPTLIMLGTVSALSVGWRITHGGFGAVSVVGWIGSLVIVALAVGAWQLLAPRMREGRS